MKKKNPQIFHFYKSETCFLLLERFICNSIGKKIHLSKVHNEGFRPLKCKPCLYELWNGYTIQNVANFFSSIFLLRPNQATLFALKSLFQLGIIWKMLSLQPGKQTFRLQAWDVIFFLGNLQVWLWKRRHQKSVTKSTFDMALHHTNYYSPIPKMSFKWTSSTPRD